VAENSSPGHFSCGKDNINIGEVVRDEKLWEMRQINSKNSKILCKETLSREK
jgi:hypothetical protein